MTTVENLKEGQTLLIDAKKVNGGKVQLQFAEIIKNPSAKSSNRGEVIGLLNASDSRFNSGPKARRGWISAEPADIQKHFGIDCSSLTTVGQTLAIGKLNPELAGKRLRLQVTETVKPTEYQAANVEQTAKRAGTDGDYITHKGQYIFSNVDVVLENATHTFLEADAPVSIGVSIEPVSSELTA